MSIDTSKFKKALERFKEDKKGLDREQQRKKLEEFRKKFGLQVPPDMKYRMPTLEEYLKRLEKKKKLEDEGGIGGRPKTMEAGMKKYAKGGGVRKATY